jgi:protein TonB
MARNNYYFYVSGLISLSLFIFILSLFIYMMFVTSQIKTYGLTKQDYISISLETPTVETKTVSKPVNTPPQEVKSVEKSKTIDVADLFSDVPAKIVKKEKPKPENSKRIEEIQKNKSKSETKEVQSFAEKVKNLDKAEKADKNTKTSAGEEVNEYIAKIQGLVYENFNPPVNTEGNSVKVLITLSPLGKVESFRILTYSGNDALNEECDRVKARLENILFPINPEGKSSSTIVILTSKE